MEIITGRGGGGRDNPFHSVVVLAIQWPHPNEDIIIIETATPKEPAIKVNTGPY